MLITMVGHMELALFAKVLDLKLVHYTDHSVCSWQKMLTWPLFLDQVCSLLFECWGRPTGARTPESRLQLHSKSLFYLVSTYRIGLVAPSKSIYCLLSPKHPKHPLRNEWKFCDCVPSWNLIIFSYCISVHCIFLMLFVLAKVRSLFQQYTWEL